MASLWVHPKIIRRTREARELLINNYWLGGELSAKMGILEAEMGLEIGMEQRRDHEIHEHSMKYMKLEW